MFVRLGFAAYVDAVDVGYGVGSDPEGHRVEFTGPWADLERLQARLDAGERVELDVEDWQIVAVDGETRPGQTLAAMAERAALLVHRSTWTRPA